MQPVDNRIPIDTYILNLLNDGPKNLNEIFQLTHSKTEILSKYTINCDAALRKILNKMTQQNRIVCWKPRQNSPLYYFLNTEEKEDFIKNHTNL